MNIINQCKIVKTNFDQSFLCFPVLFFLGLHSHQLALPKYDVVNSFENKPRTKLFDHEKISLRYFSNHIDDDEYELIILSFIN